MTSKVASLFCGCGGSDLGLLGGFDYLGKSYKKLDFEIVYALDFDKWAVDTYNKNFEHKAVCADICDVDFSEIPDVDLMIGGFPCQSFSTVNPTKDTNDARANLYKQIVRFLEVKQPKYFICENVKGLMTLQRGAIIDKILSEFSSMGYHVKYKLIKAVEFGIPQRRERVIIVGIRNDIDVKYEYPHPTNNEKNYVPLKAVIDKLYIAPGNAGTANAGENVAIKADDFDAVANFVVAHGVDMVVVGPEDPLVKGIYDYFKQRDDVKHVPVIGPSKAGAVLEGSKDFAKGFMKRHNIPTAAYETFDGTQVEEGCKFLETLKAPYVLKADGLCAGKGVLIVPTLDEAKKELRDMLGGMFGNASSRVVIEEFLSGIECSVFVLTDGKHYKILPEAKDYKRIGEGDTGLNTGGMGSGSPVPFATKEWMPVSGSPMRQLYSITLGWPSQLIRPKKIKPL